MSRKKFGVLVLCCVLFLSACSSEGRLSPNVIESLDGVLSEQRQGDEEVGTHLLLLDSGQFRALRSIAINLSDANYLGNRVTVSGFLEDDEEVFEVTGVRVLEVLGDFFADSEKLNYRNEDLGFEIPYYGNWALQESESVVRFAADNDDVVVISQRPFSYSEDGAGGNEVFEVYFRESGVVEPFSLVNVGKGDYQAALLQYGDDLLSYYLYRSGLLYEVSLIADEEITPERLRIFKEMMGGFGFTNFVMGEGQLEDEVEDSESENNGVEVALPSMGYNLNAVFESLPYSFRGNYPSNWYYAGFLSKEAGVLHEYRFSNEVVESGNEILVLKVAPLAPLPGGSSKLYLEDREIVISVSGGNTEVVTGLGSLLFYIVGPSEYKDLMINIAGSINLID